jgi:hypothetical protein
MTSDPMFVDFATRNYHLRTESPAIDAGLAGYSPETDFDGVGRPQGAAADVGGYER